MSLTLRLKDISNYNKNNRIKNKNLMKMEDWATEKKIIPFAL